MGKIDVAKLKKRTGSGYPSPYDAPMAGRIRQRLGDAAGLTQFGVNLLVLEPGAWSSQRHWHEGEDEFLVMLSGEAVLIEDEGETILRPGDCAAWPKGVANGHHLVNRSDADCVFIALSAGDDSRGSYSDIDMRWTPEGYVHKDGTPYA